MKPWLGPEEAAAAAAAVASGWVAQGPRVAAFEQAVCERVGAAHGVAVSSCTAALHLALVVAGVGPGDEVVVPSLSFIATANVPRYVGAIPVFADVEVGTQNLSAATIQPVLSAATRAVILVHQVGTPADVEAVHALCEPLGIAVIEDAACAIGSTYRGRTIGGHSDLVAFSFHPRKVITTGEGGMLMTSRAEWAERLRRLREHGMNVSAAARHGSSGPVIEQYLETAFNYRMTDIQAAVGIVQLGRLSAIVERRRALASRYREWLGDLPGLTMAGDPASGRTNYQSFWVLLPEDWPLGRNELLHRMMEAGISPRRGIMASHLEPAFAGHPHIPLPVTERLTHNSLLLPMFHDMTEQQQRRVVAALRKEAGASAA
ncbi:MAG: DegT/DnrJ/EryC1/StrS family aminotransferase [Actinomycetota bacterium]|nr:DegT/DnrJ/EryC1/StrS family aminotransferase [Actinomycetota bacterium]